MKILLHYIKCLFQIIKQFIKRIYEKIKTSVECYIAIKQCKQALKRQNIEKVKSIPKLSSWLKDAGGLSDDDIFLHESSLDLSIIVPMYNVEEYIVDCINSVLQQKTKYQYEIILVDDGSTDDTSCIVRQFLQNERVVLITQNNQGQSVARNKAITNSKGRYLMMLDGDDLLTDDSIDVLMDAAVQTNSDIVEGKICRFTDKLVINLKEESKRIRIEKPQENSKFVLSCYGYSVAKIYRRELWETLRYPEGYIFEDIISKFILRRKANQVAFIDYSVYGYRWNPNSSSHDKNYMKKLDSILVLPKIIELCDQEQVPKDDVFYMLCLNHIGILNYVTTRPLEEEKQKSCFEEMIKQLDGIKKYKPRNMPYMFVLLDNAIREQNFIAWKLTADTIIKYELLKNYREIN